MTNNFMARLRTKDGSVAFSKTGSLEEITEAIVRALPADILCELIPTPDGKGYEVRQVGTFVVDLVTGAPRTLSSQVVTQQPTPATPPLSAAYPPLGLTPSPQDESKLNAAFAAPTPRPDNNYAPAVNNGITHSEPQEVLVGAARQGGKTKTMHEFLARVKDIREEIASRPKKPRGRPRKVAPPAVEAEPLVDARPAPIAKPGSSVAGVIHGTPEDRLKYSVNLFAGRK